VTREITSELILHLRKNEIDSPYELHFLTRIDEALDAWTSRSRVSPIFPLNSATPPDLAGLNKSTICFIGPIYPGLIPSNLRAFLTLGLYNIVLVATTPTETKSLQQLLQRNKGQFAWEQWSLSGNTVVDVSYQRKESSSHAPRKKWRGTIEHQLLPAIDEYQALFATTMKRGSEYIDSFGADLLKFDLGFRATLKPIVSKVKSNRRATTTSPPRHYSEKLSQVVAVNAALSRYSSQTFAGISPIAETECHFWTHSLLGAGTATRALIAIRDHVGYLAKVARFEARIEECRKQAAPADNIYDGSNEWWTKSLDSEDKSGYDEWLPFVVFYSGRDGFKSSQFTMSVPLECVKAANTHAWSLQTITHEISHWFVERILASLVTKDDIESTGWTKKMLDILSRRNEIHDEHTFLVALLTYGIARIDAEHDSSLGSPKLESRRFGTVSNKTKRKSASSGAMTYESAKDLQDAIRANWGEIEELFAHVFDFYYFYKSDVGTYISGIWRSWDAIPNNKSKIDQYIVRCLCAIHLNNISLSNAPQITLTRLQTELDQLKKIAKNNQYIDLAATALQRDQNLFKERLIKRSVLVRIAKKIMCNDNIAQLLNARGTHTSSHRSSPPNDPNVTLRFAPNRQIENPLRFIDEITKDAKADAKKSAWILTQLAFTIQNELR
jgi:hypothetical protein